ncbi:HEAT repeat domain-containing protein, partial [bacterium]|nr:HEAT repeat domain-containing protein [bacterium]
APILARLAGAYRTSRREREKAFAGLSPEQRKLLDENLVALVVEEDEFGFRLSPALQQDQRPLWAALDLVKWGPIWRSGLFLMLEIERACEGLKPLRGDWRGTVRIETPEGAIELSGIGPDRHEQAAAIIIDLGGDDSYVGAACQAWIVDMGGNDRYRGGSVSLGAGILDVRVLWDQEGDDIYEGEAMTEGFGAFGIGLLLDDKGNDTYRAQLYAQGASRTWGAGMLADRTGDDLYQAGGRVIHKPLLEKERATFGMAQGFSIGYRPDRSGGIGILWDGAGDDVYMGGTYTQGASYWFSFGLLVDDSGNDRYTAFYYSQASAMHLTVAALIDGAGNDIYAAHMGAVHAIGHDWGVALLWDKGGNDVYSGDSAPGVGVANGIGIFVDSGGDDRYVGPPGVANPARDSGSVAIFVDLGGKDRYGRGLSDGGLALHSRWGVARDFEDPPAPAAPKDPTAEGTVPATDPQKWHGAVGSRAVGTDAELEKLYEEASLWAVGSTRDRAWTARRALVEIGLPAARFMVEKKLASAQSLNIEAFTAVLGEIGAESGKLLVEPLRSKDRATLENALRLVVSLRATDARDEVLRLLKESREMRRAAIGAAGALALKEAVPIIVDSAKELDAFGHLSVAKALGQIGDASAVPWLAKNFEDAELPVREASADALVKIGQPALETLAKLARSTKTIPSRLALRALGELDKPESLGALRERSGDPDWGVRLSVLVALKGMKTDGAELAYKETLAKEKDPRVTRAIESLDTSRDKW